MTTATTAADLLPAICDPQNFPDDALRLAFADLLEEQGEADRAEFVRVQVAVACADCPWCRPDYPCRGGGECRKAPLRRREREFLFRADGRCRRCDWHAPLTHGRGDFLAGTWEYRRGFVAEVSCACADWLAHGPALVRRQPVEVVRLTDKGPTEYVHGGDVSYWRWFNGSRGSGRRYEDAPVDMTCDELPGRLWKVYSRLVTAHGMTWEHPSEAEAIDALSAAALAWARATGPTP